MIALLLHTILAALKTRHQLAIENLALWKTFLRNHSGEAVSIDFFTVPTTTFRVLYVFLVLSHNRRRVVQFNLTEFPVGQAECPPTDRGVPVGYCCKVPSAR